MRRPGMILLLLTWLWPEARGQFIFDNLKPKDGLSTREVMSVYQDSEGFMWMGAVNGLNRFDGSRFLLWNRSTPSYPIQLSETVTAIIEHYPGEIWFVASSGMAVFDKTTRQITEVPVMTKKGEKAFVSRLVKDKEKRLWMICNTGLYFEKDRKFFPVSNLYPYAAALDTIHCHSGGFYYDSTRRVFWIASTTGLYCLDPNKQQLYHAGNNPSTLPIYVKQPMNAVAISKHGDIWYSISSAGGLYHYDFKTGKQEYIPRINDNPQWEIRSGCNMLFFDDQDRLWISTWLFTSFVRYPDGRFEKIPYDEKLPYSIGYGLIYEAMQDSYGNLWFATLNGVSKISAAGFIEKIVHVPTEPYYLPVSISNVTGIKIDSDSNWWLSKLEGLEKYDPATGGYEIFTPFPGGGQKNSIANLEIVDGEIWCASGFGIVVFNPVTEKFRTMMPKEGMRSRFITNIYQDSKGYIWFVSWNDAVYRYEKRTGSFLRFDEHTADMGDFRPSYSYAFQETSDHKLWISNGQQGIRIYDYASQQFSLAVHPILNKVQVFSIAEDKSKFIWCSTEEYGILKFNQAGELLDSINRKNGLMVARYDHLTFDKAGRLWTKSKEALLCIKLPEKQITRVNIDVTFSFNDHWNRLYLRDDKLYASMLDNVVVLAPEKFQTGTSSSPPLIAGFRVFQNEIPFSPGKRIKLSYKQNFFSIDFSSPFHREDAFIEYAYQLEGFDKDWVHSGRAQTASYTNVPDGDYSFLVRTKDASGQWSQAVTRLDIHIASPFWKTAWFIALILLLIAGILYLLYRRRMHRQRRANIEKTIDYFANSVYGENSVNEICWDIARNCTSQLQFEDCVVYLKDPNTGKLVQKAAYGPKNPKGHEIVNPIEIRMGQGIVGTVAQTGKPLLIPDTSKDKRYLVDDEPRLSELAVPILHDNRVIGVIDSEHPNRNFFTQEHLKAMTTIASISSNKIAEALAEEHAHENEIKLLEINKMLAESQLMALRAQMNPHFVFNCLNSIQECIVTQKYGEASKYLNKFSKLFRMVLNNSGRNLVTLQEEKEVLELYLELEEMRFERSFSYSIEMDEDLEPDDILIPSMLLQPYVENALWHGLMHKEGDRRLLISFEKVNEDIFRCTIDDNGIGRQKSFELKAQQSKAKRHESRGLKISKDRIDVLQKQGYHACLEIIDKTNGSGIAAGTTVKVELSSFLKN